MLKIKCSYVGCFFWRISLQGIPNICGDVLSGPVTPSSRSKKLRDISCFDLVLQLALKTVTELTVGRMYKKLNINQQNCLNCFGV